jgi:hypothetical protein
MLKMATAYDEEQVFDTIAVLVTQPQSMQNSPAFLDVGIVWRRPFILPI